MTLTVKLALVHEYGTQSQVTLVTNHPELLDTIYNTIVGHN